MPLFQCDQSFLPENWRAAVAERHDAATTAVQQLADKTAVGSEWTGWYRYPQTHGRDVMADAVERLSRLDVYHDLVIVVGIGGSYLGARAVAEALTPPHMALQKSKGQLKPIVYAGHHLAESEMLAVLDLIETHQPIVNVISKSGTTTEPAVAFRAIRAAMEQRFGPAEAAKRIVATTDGSKGALRELATTKGYETFVVPDDIGGRFSVLSPVGVVPLQLAGFKVERLMDGAAALFEELNQPAGHAVVDYAAARHVAFEQGKRIELLAYNQPQLNYLVEWWKQLFGESEGKQHLGLFPAGLAYTTDLHSLGQYAQDGVRNLMETFLELPPARVRDASGAERRLTVPGGDGVDGLNYLEGRPLEDINNTAFAATRVAHFDGGVPCVTLRGPAPDEFGIGALFAFFETTCAVSGALLGVNPFDQPGVEEYKKNLFGLLGKPGFEELGERLQARLGGQGE